LLRIIEMQAPTLLLDEMDTAMKQDREMAEALRGIINQDLTGAGRDSEDRAAGSRS
jgi:hypothetical protein